MLRIYCLQQWYQLSDPDAEDAEIVLISGEYPYRTPLSLWTGNNMLGVKIHANIAAQLIG